MITDSEKHQVRQGSVKGRKEGVVNRTITVTIGFPSRPPSHGLRQRPLPKGRRKQTL